MSVRNLIPWGRRTPASDDSLHPVVSLQREMNRLFDDMFRGFDMSFPADFGARALNGSWPRLEVSDDDDAVRVSAELPGMEEKDVEILRSEEHTSELQSRENLVCRLLLEKKKNQQRWI